MFQNQTSQEERKPLSRRALLGRSAIAGALGVGVAMVGGACVLKSAPPPAAPSSSVRVNLAAEPHPASARSVLIYGSGPRSGEVEIFGGTPHTGRSLSAWTLYLAPR